MNIKKFAKLAGANSIFTPKDIREKSYLFENTGYCLLQSEIPLATIEVAYRMAHEHSAKTNPLPVNL